MAELDDAGPPPGELPLLGYPDRWSVAPGETIDFMVSSSAGDFDAEVVRLRHGDENPDGPGLRETVVPGVAGGHHPGRLQVAYAGSYVRVDGFGDHARESFTMLAWIAPTTLPIERPQGILGDLGDRSGAALVIEPSGSLALLLGRDGAPATLSSGRPMTAGEWHLVAAGYEARNRRAWVLQLPLAPWDLQGQVFRTATVEADYTGRGAGTALLIGALAAGAGGPDEAAEATGRTPAGGPTWAHFNGKIEGPRVFGASPSPAELEALLDAPDQVLLGEPMTAGTIASWDFAVGIASTRVTDTGPHGLHGEIVGMPTRESVTGHGWTGTALSPEAAPEEYGAIHFHEDDLSDAAGGRLPVEVPELRSGVYALRSERRARRPPFFVHPARPDAATSACVADVQLPRLRQRALFLDDARDGGDGARRPFREAAAPGPLHGRQPPAQPLRRPFRRVERHDLLLEAAARVAAAEVLHAADPCPAPVQRRPALVDWLENKGFAHDVLTDHALHEEGVELLGRYRVVLTGSHPEYWTEPMLDAMEGYLAGGGRLMYLGGNGFFWSTAIRPDMPHVIEVRRGHAGVRPSESSPGEEYMSATGEPAGKWRYRGRPPQRLVGVGYTTQGSSWSRPYRRLPASHDPRCAFIFEGVGDDEVIGDFGLVMGGAGGAETDRVDPALGTPPHTLVLATADGFSDHYQAALDDFMFSDSKQSASVSPLVRADMVFFEAPNGARSSPRRRSPGAGASRTTATTTTSRASPRTCSGNFSPEASSCSRRGSRRSGTAAQPSAAAVFASSGPRASWKSRPVL